MPPPLPAAPYRARATPPAPPSRAFLPVSAGSWAVLLASAITACGPKADSAAPPLTPSVGTAPPPAAGRSAEVVNATVLANGCQSLGQANAQMAERAMYDLVEDCTSVPGSSAAFRATLRPGGRIDIAAAPGQPAVVPICVLKHALTHKVILARPCVLDVKLQETAVTVAPAPPR